ncbi:E3 ubiquitin-protein ligase Os04g0590900-like [Tasmannia lanceolata]|uniref:E3 ubiquitin-protein ligase Os04g0590900-like n=1 Tax=Tasmannia lanceolata TaxID=3420 RepID=UPI004062CA09
MELPGSPPSPQSDMFKPLLISMIGIVAFALALVVYHILVTRFCSQGQQLRQQQRFLHGNMANGVDKKVLETIPIHTYTTKQEGLFIADQSECVVCLGELEEGDPVRLLPNCGHVFHLQCIDEWFASHSNCPLCRSPVVAPMSPPNETGEQEDHVVVVAAAAGDDDISCARVHSRPLLRPCASLLLPIENKRPQKTILLNRSLSMDSSYVSLKIPIDHADDPISSMPVVSSSSLKVAYLRSGSSRRLSLKRSLYKLSSIGKGGTDIESLPR